mmetsp:Transcript_26984/g.86711  ORF Transcript_26984/g.86711 Transcript_26984/m.86711 type:complete len:151 (-) Transcript_26984:82-534(-)
MPKIDAPGFNFPYVEGLTIEEAMNDLAFMSVGIYQEPLYPQQGAPIRLTVPWKYGFKSIKSIVKIEFIAERPKTYWNEANGNEYGFFANVNPAVRHPRWSQANERQITNNAFCRSSDCHVPTKLFNGYEKYVKDMYANITGPDAAILYMR